MQFFNFSSGPATLSPEIYLQIQRESIPQNSPKTPLLLASHRSDYFYNLIDEAKSLTQNLLHVPNHFSILFLPTGASYHFYLSALNLLNPSKSAAFLISGYWAQKALKAASDVGKTYVAASSETQNFSLIPKAFSIRENTQYLHITTNNTIYGTQLHTLPNPSVPIVADMSSDIFSKPIEWSNIGMVYACAQKNFGIPSLTLCIIRNDMLGKTETKIPEILDYQAHIKANSIFNTASVLQVFVAKCMLEWTLNQGGVEHFQRLSILKSQYVYDAIDSNPLFNGTCITEDRSRMNVCFSLVDKSLESTFLKHAENHGLYGLEGHRHLGGFRAALYNPIPLEAAQALANAIIEFKG